jgi:PAS domain S-box-containing protein
MKDPEENPSDEVLIPQTIEKLQAKINESIDFKTALDEHAILSITDSNGIITYVNEKFCIISKYSSSELLGSDYSIVNSDYHSKEFWHEMWDTIRSGKVWKNEIQNRAKDGSLYWVDTTIVPFYDDQENLAQFVNIRTDITLRKRIENEREKFIHALQTTLSEVKALPGYLPICCNCKMVRDDTGNWNQIESYISNHTSTLFSHGYCPTCIRKVYEDSGIPTPEQYSQL